MPIDAVLAGGGDYLDDEERQRLHESLREKQHPADEGGTDD